MYVSIVNVFDAFLNFLLLLSLDTSLSKTFFLNWFRKNYLDPQLEMIPICKIIDSKTVYDEAFYMVYLFQKMKQIFQRRVWDYYNIKDELLCKKWNNRKPLFAAEVFGEVFKFYSQIWLQPIDTEAEWDSPVLWYRMI